MNRDPKTSSLKVKATRQIKGKQFSYRKEKIAWVISLPFESLTINQFIELMALIGITCCLKIIVEWAYPFVKEIIDQIKELLRYDNDK